MVASIKTKINLDKNTHVVRASQAVLQYGVGAMVDFPSQTLMTAAPEYWADTVKQIHDERLEKLLHVDYFGLPVRKDESKANQGIAYARFPEWYFCPKCRKFQPLSKWIEEFDRNASSKQHDTNQYMHKSLKCSICKQDLVVARIVSVCECGHIDDFPWIEWVHCQNQYEAKPICDKPSLKFKTSATSAEGLEGLTVSCEYCKARATLRGAFDKDKFKDLFEKYGGAYNFRCKGRHPWKNEREKCSEFPRALQRGGSSVYFPITASSLVIPPYSSILTKKVESSKVFEELKGTVNILKSNPTMTSETIFQVISLSLDECAERISLQHGVSKNQVKLILERKFSPSNNEADCSTASVKYRYEEYKALTGMVAVESDDYGDFVRDATDNDLYKIPGIKQISLIHKIREVQALTAFSRLKPIEQFGDNTGSDYAVPIKKSTTNWYPAYEVRGEGIFIEFDNSIISKWMNNREIQKRVDLVNENYAKSYIGQNNPRKISAKFLLLHTISHLLIKQLSFECGYSISSLKERLYCSEELDGAEMSGVLIYTASGDSEGTMGGLVRQGRYDTFPVLYKKAIESAITCSNDPVCSLSMGQGRDSLNLAACYSCCLIPETSCEEYNAFLDRGTVVGSFENKNMGFYYEQLYNHSSWKSTKNTSLSENIESERNINKNIIILENGMDLSDTPIVRVFEELKNWVENQNEIDVLQNLMDYESEFSSKECPRQNCKFTISGLKEVYKSDIMWIRSKVAFFTDENKDGYEAACLTDWKCILASDFSESIDSIISMVKER